MTFSISARCPRTGQFGVAVSTAVPGVGWWVPYAKPGVGAIASQALCNPYLGILGMQLLERGVGAEETLRRVLAADPQRERRQLAVIDSQGGSAAFTGSETHDWQGHITGQDYAAAGNTLVGPAVVKALSDVMQATAELDLSERLVRALEAAQTAGGDKRGRQSAAILVMGSEAYPYLDARVDDHADPVPELRRLLGIAEERRKRTTYYSTRRSDMGPVEGLDDR